MSHNSAQRELPFKLRGSYLKTKYALEHNAGAMIREHGLNACLFVTLTVGTSKPCAECECGGCDAGEHFVQVWEHAEASRRVNLIARRFLPSIFAKWIIVTERHKSGAIHFHLLAAMLSGADVRTGFYEGGPNAELLEVWRLFREHAERFGFGRCESKPIEKAGDAVACYVAKYVEKHLFNRRADDARKKLVRYGGFQKRQLKPNEFGWATEGAMKWRLSARYVAKAAAGLSEREQVANALGGRWALRISEMMPLLEVETLGFVDVGFLRERWQRAESLFGRHERTIARRESERREWAEFVERFCESPATRQPIPADVQEVFRCN